MSEPLHQQLRAALAASTARTICAAYSGGPDSTVLLHVLSQLPEARERGLRVLHVDHGLHPDSADWAGHCRKFCEALDVPLRIARVQVNDDRGEGLESAARRARRTAFAGELHDGEWLALAHHRDDQVETVLLKLLRGAGPEGLGGMHTLRPFARGFLWRPLLDQPRAVLRGYVSGNSLPCIHDPANEDSRFSRNILRNEILPLVAQHWPHADAAILHAASLCRANAGFIHREVETVLPLLRRKAGTLDADAWLALPKALRAPVLHRWLRERGLPIPADAQYRQLEHQASSAAEDALPCVTWPGAQVRIWEGRLHATPHLAPPPDDWLAAWAGAPLALPDDCGTLALETAGVESPRANHVFFDPPLSVRVRHGGERIKPAGDAHTRELRDLFQHARIPPWLRERCPLIYADDELIAVADLWLSARGKAVFDERAVRPLWMRPAWLNA